MNPSDIIHDMDADMAENDIARAVTLKHELEVCNAERRFEVRSDNLHSLLGQIGDQDALGRNEYTVSFDSYAMAVLKRAGFQVNVEQDEMTIKWN